MAKQDWKKTVGKWHLLRDTMVSNESWGSLSLSKSFGLRVWLEVERKIRSQEQNFRGVIQLHDAEEKLK